jgi:pimeloyl-ACP methyl ester carboxylesterase
VKRYSASRASIEVSAPIEVSASIKAVRRDLRCSGSMTTQQTDSGGTPIAWERRGAGVPVVLVHGITECRASWEPVAERLAVDHDVIAIDLRGHGESGIGPRYDLADLAGDVHAVIVDAGVERPHLVGHSLGGAVVSGLGALGGARSVVNVDQSLQLSAFKEQLVAAEAMLRDPDAFPLVIAGLFDQLVGERLSAVERERISALRRPDQSVVLGVWQLLLQAPVDEVDAAMDAALAGYRASSTAYLSIMGVDPGEGYAAWIAERVPGALTEVWPDHGHYPHLVDPDRFVTRLREFWSRH